MKTKKFEKQLVLNKETIVNLAKEEIKAVKGGELETSEWICLGSRRLSCDFFCYTELDTECRC